MLMPTIPAMPACFIKLSSAVSGVGTAETEGGIEIEIVRVEEGDNDVVAEGVLVNVAVRDAVDETVFVSDRVKLGDFAAVASSLRLEAATLRELPVCCILPSIQSKQ